MLFPQLLREMMKQQRSKGTCQRPAPPYIVFFKKDLDKSDAQRLSSYVSQGNAGPVTKAKGLLSPNML